MLGRGWVFGVIAVAIAGGGAGATFLSANNAPPTRLIKVTAQKYFYAPATINAKVGETIILDLTAVDRIHGFSIADLDVRRDLVPGEDAQVKLHLTKAGRYTFACDIFCGDDHDTMSGIIVVSSD